MEPHGVDQQDRPVGEPHAATPEPQAVRADLRAVGDRIETLLDASSSGGIVVRERAEELVRLLSDLYGAGLERMLEILYENGALGEDVLEALADDDLVASLLLVHDLHPFDTTTRVERALDSVRPYLLSHGGDVQLLGVTQDGVAQLRLLGSCDGCASSAATMSLAVEDAIFKAAPEITGFDVQSPAAPPAAGRPLLSLEVVPHGPNREEVPPSASGSWEFVPGLDELAGGEVLGTTVGGVAIIVCRNGTDLLAFRDECAGCGASLKSATLERRLGVATGSAVLTCPSCRTHYDVRLAGAAIGAIDSHLDPLPLLSRDGRIAVAIPAAAR